jgi:predicted RNA-binding protein
MSPRLLEIAANARTGIQRYLRAPAPAAGPATPARKPNRYIEPNGVIMRDVVAEEAIRSGISYRDILSDIRLVPVAQARWRCYRTLQNKHGWRQVDIAAAFRQNSSAVRFGLRMLKERNIK